MEETLPTKSFKEEVNVRLNCFIASATINRQLPDTCFWGKDPRGAEKVLRSRLQFGFPWENRRRSLKGGFYQTWCVFRWLPGSLCLSPDPSCHLQPGRSCNNQTNRPSAL